MNRKRCVLIGMMSEICMKSRILLLKVKQNSDLAVLAEVEKNLSALELEMSTCVAEMERLVK